MTENNIRTSIYHPVSKGIHVSTAGTQVNFILSGNMLMFSSFCSSMEGDYEYITPLPERIDHPGCCIQVIETVTAKIGGKSNQSIPDPVIDYDHGRQGMGTCRGYTMAFQHPFGLQLPGGTKIIGMVVRDADHVKSTVHKTVNIMIGHPEYKTLGGVFAFFRISQVSRKGSFQIPEGDICIPQYSVHIM
jgi:hypothetical protein